MLPGSGLCTGPTPFLFLHSTLYDSLQACLGTSYWGLSRTSTCPVAIEQMDNLDHRISIRLIRLQLQCHGLHLSTGRIVTVSVRLPRVTDQAARPSPPTAVTNDPSHRWDDIEGTSFDAYLFWCFCSCMCVSEFLTLQKATTRLASTTLHVHQNKTISKHNVDPTSSRTNYQTPFIGHISWLASLRSQLAPS